MIQLPAVIMLLVLASLVAVILHLWMGRGVRDLLLFWIAAVGGCVGGHLLGDGLGIIPWKVGQVQVVEATLGATLVVLLAAWLRPPPRDAGASKP